MRISQSSVRVQMQQDVDLLRMHRSTPDAGWMQDGCSASATNASGTEQSRIKKVCHLAFQLALQKA